MCYSSTDVYRIRCKIVENFKTHNKIRHHQAMAGDILDDQTHVDLKPASQPEHASLNQCQLIAANRPKLVLWATPTGGGDTISR